MIEVVKGIGGFYKFILSCWELHISAPVLGSLHNLPVKFVESVAVLEDDCGVDLVEELVDKASGLLCACELVGYAIKEEESASHELSTEPDL